MFEKMKGMTFKEKVEYYFQYYGLVTVIVIVAVIFVVSMTVNFVKSKRIKAAASVIVINGQDSGENTELDALFEEILTDQELDLKRNTIDIMGPVSVGDNVDAQSAYYGLTQLQAYLVAGQGDVVFCSEDYQETFLGFNALTDLSTILPEDVLAEHEEDIIYYTDDETGDTYPAMIYVDTDSELLKTAGWYTEDVKAAVGIGYEPANEEVAEEILLKALGD